MCCIFIKVSIFAESFQIYFSLTNKKDYFISPSEWLLQCIEYWQLFTKFKFIGWRYFACACWRRNNFAILPVTFNLSGISNDKNSYKAASVCEKQVRLPCILPSISKIQCMNISFKVAGYEGAYCRFTKKEPFLCDFFWKFPQ